MMPVSSTNKKISMLAAEFAAGECVHAEVSIAAVAPSCATGNGDRANVEADNPVSTTKGFRCSLIRHLPVPPSQLGAISAARESRCVREVETFATEPVAGPLLFPAAESATSPHKLPLLVPARRPGATARIVLMQQAA